MAPRESDGVSTTGLINALRQSGIGVRLVADINFDKFANAISQGFPVITLIRTDEADIEHWVVIYGVGENPKRIFVAGNALRGQEGHALECISTSPRRRENRTGLLGKVVARSALRSSSATNINFAS